MAETNVILGIELLEVGTASNIGIVSDWVRLENIAPDSVTHTKNNGTVTGVIPEDKDVALFSIFAPADPGTLTIGVLEQKPSVMQKLFNTVYDPATSLLTVLSKERIANLAVRITTRPVNGRKCIITWYNTNAQTGFANNIAKTVQENLAIVATILSYSFNGQDASYSKQWVLEDGTPINSTPATVSAGTNSTTTTATKVLTGTATPAAGKTIVSQYWTLVSGPNNPTMATPTALSNSVSGLVTGVYVFKLTAIDSAGVETSATTQLTATIA